MDDIKKDPFEEYIRQTEPSRRELGYAWYTAMGLQAVDGLETSDYLKKTARKNIEGEITLSEAGKLIESYYEESSERSEDRTKKRISFRPELLRSFLKRHLLFRFRNTSVFIGDCFPESFRMPEKYGITISQKKSGFWTENLFIMEMHRNCGRY